MRLRIAVALCGITVALLACDDHARIQEPTIQASELDRGTQPSPSFMQVGIQSGDIIPATFKRSYPYDPAAMMENCGPHACGGRPLDASLLGIFPDKDLERPWADIAVFGCPNGSADTIPSTHSCWECKDYCAANCLDEACAVVVGSYGSDCRGYNCPEGYEIQWGPIGKAPMCKKVDEPPPPVDEPPPPTPTVTIHGPTKIAPGGQCTWTAHASSGTPPYSYSWTYNYMWDGSGPTYTGGVKSGTLYPEFRLHVYVTDANGKSASDNILVTEDPYAVLCPM